MRQGQNARRSRGRGGNNNNNNGGGGNGGGNGGGGNGGGGGGGQRRQNAPMRHQTFDSNGPDVRIRGNAWQVYEKYQALARDASSSGDRVTAESYSQHAEHYYRIILQIQESEARQQQQRGQHHGHHQGNGGGQPMSQPMNGMQDGDEDGDGEAENAMVEDRGMAHA